ncbi:MAG TPA: hypothetical protein VNS58_14855 [Puia sp.]|nr:hypothetical protein [Puia sp.]
MEKELPSDQSSEDRAVELGFEPARDVFLLLNISLFAAAIKACREAVTARIRRAEIQKLLAIGWFEHYKDKKTGRRVLSESNFIEHDHEKRTAICLAQMNYDVIFAPAGMFQRGKKKFDIYLLRDTVILEADLKCISSKNPLTIAYRIKEGSEQASRVVVDIKSDIYTNDLIDGLRSGTGKNNLIKEIFLFYKNKFYILPKNLIWSKQIYNILKSEKGYT